MGFLIYFLGGRINKKYIRVVEIKTNKIKLRHFARSTPAWLFSTVCNEGGWELHTDVVDRVASRSDRSLTLRHKSPVPDPPDVSLECPPLGSVNRIGSRHLCPSRAVGVYELSVGQSCTYEIISLSLVVLTNRTSACVLPFFKRVRYNANVNLGAQNEFLPFRWPCNKKWDVIGVRVRAHFVVSGCN